MADSVLEKIKRFSDDQFSNEERLNARVQLYRYTERNIDFHKWIFEHLNFQGVENVLDLGCGTGLVWLNNIDRIPENIHIMLSDVSEGMVDSCRKKLSNDARFGFEVCDAANTPFESGKYQMILANHMLNFFEDLERIFRELSRLLADGGCIYSTTPSLHQGQELFTIADGFDDSLKVDIGLVRVFNVENGEDELTKHFNVIKTDLFQNDVVTDDIDALILYLASCFENVQLENLVRRYDGFRKHVRSVIAEKGQFRMTNKAALFKYDKKSPIIGY